MKILIVSPFFPPEKTVAVIRISSLVRELLKQGHELTIIRNEYDQDELHLSDDDIEFNKLKQYKVNVDPSVRFFEASKRYKNVFKKVLDKEKFDLVLITAGPFYTIPLVKIAKTEYNTKCIIDYRDLWVFDIRNIKDFFKPLNIVKKIVYFPIEKANINHANLVVTVTEEWKQILKKVYRKNKFEVVANGYDDEQLNRVKSLKDNPYPDKFVITVFGKLAYYSVDYGVKFFKALKALSENYPDLLVLHVGLPEKETEKAIEVSGFDKQKYKNTGFIQYTEGIQLLKKSKVNVIIDVRKGAMGTKFYDYIYVNKPIIYFGKKNTQLDNMVKKFENGFSCYDEADLIKVVTKIKEYHISSLTISSQLENYSRSQQNKKYIKLMEKICKQ